MTCFKVVTLHFARRRRENAQKSYQSIRLSTYNSNPMPISGLIHMSHITTSNTYQTVVVKLFHPKRINQLSEGSLQT